MGSIPYASGSTHGITRLSLDPVNPTDPIAVGDNDPRNTNARPPTGAAGGDLTGNYPNPLVADNAITSTKIAPESITNTHIHTSAGIVESKLALNYPTHSNTNDPTSDEKQALAGTYGTPSSTNKYVTNSDPRNTNARTPLAHATTHQSGGSDVIYLRNLGDTNIGTPTDGQVLMYDGTTSKWREGNITGGGGDCVVPIVKVDEWQMTGDVVIENTTTEITITERLINFDFNTYKYFTVEIISNGTTTYPGAHFYVSKNSTSYASFVLFIYVNPTSTRCAFEAHFGTNNAEIYGRLQYMVINTTTSTSYPWQNVVIAIGKNQSTYGHLLHSSNFASYFCVGTLALGEALLNTQPDRIKITGQWSVANTNHFAKFRQSLFRVYGHKI